MIHIPNDEFFSWVESEIAQGHNVQIRLKGRSMYPLLREDKDEVILSACSPNELQVMDVVLFKYGGTYILHRIINISGNILTIRGDGSFNTIEKCTADDIIGRVEAIVRPSGKVISVKSLRWKVASNLWQSIGIFRGPILRCLRLKS